MELLKKILRRLLLSPLFRWFVPEHDRFMLSLPDMLKTSSVPRFRGVGGGTLGHVKA